MESIKHMKARYAMERLLLEDNYKILFRDNVDALPVLLTPLGLRQYIPDIFAEKDGFLYTFEADGTKGHSTKSDLEKMKLRDETLAAIDIVTVRLKVDDLVGYKKQSDNQNRLEIAWQIANPIKC